MLNYRRLCAVCQSPLAGKKGHGFVTSSGVICGDFKRHERIRRQKKRQRFDKLDQDMLVFELEVSGDNLLTEVD